MEHAGETEVREVDKPKPWTWEDWLKRMGARPEFMKTRSRRPSEILSSVYGRLTVALNASRRLASEIQLTIGGNTSEDVRPQNAGTVDHLALPSPTSDDMNRIDDALRR